LLGIRRTGRPARVVVRMSESGVAGSKDVARSEMVVDACRLSYRRRGSGAPLLFLHGEDGVWGWEPWMERLAERFDVIVPDHPAFGFSDWPDWLDNVHDVAYFYLDVLDALQLRDVHLVGHSLGGWIACELAVRCGHALRSVTLVGSGGIRLTGVPKFDRFIVPPADVVRRGFADAKHADAVLAEERDAEARERELRNQFAVARLQWQPRHDLHLPKWLHRINVPAQLVWGADDRLVPPAYADEFARLILGARVVKLPNCGHFPQLEAPDAFATAMTSFIDGLH
jgi:pimeloyl-ACP methyl ester carboxylesterase